MFNQMQQIPVAPVTPQLLPSKRSYKKLGTILEHIAKSINPYFYQFSVVVTRHYPIAVNIKIETIPTDLVPQAILMCVIPWMDGSNGQIYINSNTLIDTTEW